MKYVVAVLFALFLLPCLASQRAVTDEGEIVILHDNGTWEFEDPGASRDDEIPVNEAVFQKADESTFRLKSTKNDSEVWLNSKKWMFKKGATDEDAEYTFQLRGQDLYGQLITEQITVDADALTELALANARAVSPNMRISMREYRTVNGNNAIYMEMQGDVQGTKLTFAGYYFSNPSGTTQLLTYTGTNLLDKYRPEIEAFLNGFATQ